MKQANQCFQDVVSYQVKKLEPVLELDQIGGPTGNLSPLQADQSLLINLRR
jgi:hypothetical protein